MFARSAFADFVLWGGQVPPSLPAVVKKPGRPPKIAKKSGKPSVRITAKLFPFIPRIEATGEDHTGCRWSVGTEKFLVGIIPHAVIGRTPSRRPFTLP
jgi:hypothetical protein